jgi:predicted GNAT family N-acyltransferase
VCDFRIELVKHGWHRFDEVLDLSYAVLYGPFGVAREGDWYHPAHGSDFAIALDAQDRLVGTARLLPASGDGSRQVRQVAVDPQARGRGTGHAMMRALERSAAENGAIELWLHAREDAIGFYERMGYIPEGLVFVSELTGIPHRTMRKRLE